MATKQVLTFPRDVLPRYFVGGLWRSADANKRPSRTTSSRGKLRIVAPPPPRAGRAVCRNKTAGSPAAANEPGPAT
jgi:hypothetical protein